MRLRPGNAGANNVIDLVGVLDAGIDGLPQDIAAGHRLGDDRGLVRRDVQVRADSAAGRTFALACRARNVGFAVVARSNEQIHAAISRGEPLHPGAQQSLFPSECYRYWGHYTDSDGDSVELDRHMRAHAHVEDNIRRLKDSAASRFPFCDFDANAAWLATVCMADSLVRWFQQLCLSGPLATAEPKTLRWSLWHTPARIVHRARTRTVRVLDGWPTAAILLDAYQRLALIT